MVIDTVYVPVASTFTPVLRGAISLAHADAKADAHKCLTSGNPSHWRFLGPIHSQGKGIRYAHTSSRVVGDIAGNDFQIVNQRRRGDLFVEWILGMGDPKMAPDVRDLLSSNARIRSAYTDVTRSSQCSSLCA